MKEGHLRNKLLEASCLLIYSKTYDVSFPQVDNKIVDHSDVVGAVPVRAAPTTSSFAT